MELAVKPPDAVKVRLSNGGWQVVDPVQITRDTQTYQAYLRNSRAEFSVAKHGYVVTRCGWFSERSAGYLASGRPVLVQDTGFVDWLETGSGVIPYSNIEEACHGIADINERYSAHCRAAREIAETYFDARRVLSDLLERSMATVPAAIRYRRACL
jgi:hypothetical protein